MPRELDSEIEAVGRIGAVRAILDVVCRVTGMGFAAVARVTEDRWIACWVKDDIAFGLEPGDELKVETTICHEIRQHREAVIISDVAANEAYRQHPTPALYGFRSYISVPIVLPDGEFFGTLCAIDPATAALDRPEIRGMFTLFAELIALHIAALDMVATSRANLLEEREKAALREQFIAVLGHDLRNPLAGIAGGAGMLKRAKLDEKSAAIVTLIQQSVDRMSGLIDNILDFARGRFGGGLTLERNSREAVAPLLAQTIAELRAGHPGSIVRTAVDVETPIICDPSRLSQLFSNLIANALTHGAPGTPIDVRATTRGDRFEFSVSNAGEPIPPAAMGRLFGPFTRGDGRVGGQGLGLGLYIALQIARAHNGTLTVTSTPEKTCFTFRMPIG